MEISAGVFHKNASFSCPCSNSMKNHEKIANLKSRKVTVSCSRSSMLCLSSKGNLKISRFYDEGCLEYYSKIKCGKKEKDVEMKKTKKKMKLLKGLSKDLSCLSEMGFGFGSDVGLVDQVQGKTISETAELLLAQLQQLKAEEESKRKRKEEKALMKKKEANQVQNTMNCEMSSSSSSSESSSSEDECDNLVDMKNLKCKSLTKKIPEACDQQPKNEIQNPGVDQSVEISNASLAQTIPEACDRQLNSAASLVGNDMVGPQIHNREVNASAEISAASSTSSVSLVSLERKEDDRKLEGGDCCIGNVGNSLPATAATTLATGAKKIEVCMGGKCKRSGAAAILEELQRVVGIEAAVSGCKCMGKCKVGPNVKVSGSCTDAFQADDSVSVSSTSTSLCVGVGLQDVGLIAANFLGKSPEVGLANAA